MLDALDCRCCFSEHPFPLDKPLGVGVFDKLRPKRLDLASCGSRIPVEQSVISTSHDLSRTLSAEENFRLILLAEDAAYVIRLTVDGVSPQKV
jgi:hypothetical protein